MEAFQKSENAKKDIHISSSTSSDTSDEENTKDRIVLVNCCNSKINRRGSHDDSSDSQDTGKQKSEQFVRNHSIVEHATKTRLEIAKNESNKNGVTKKCKIYNELRLVHEISKSSKTEFYENSNENNVKHIPINISINKESEVDVVQI